MVVGLFTLAGVAAGGWVTLISERRSWARSQALAARLLMAQTFPYLWRTGSWGDFQVDIGQLRAYLISVGADPSMAQPLYDLVSECWTHIDASIAKGAVDPENGPGLPTEFLARYHEVTSAIGEVLDRPRGRRVKRAGAPPR